ncbi:MAG: hypothetical protein V4466_10680 [Pseudomonadota bacterium]
MRLSVTMLALAALAIGGPALADPASDAPVSTASATSSAPSTQDQIDGYLASSPAYSSPAYSSRDDIERMGVDEPREIHGEVDLSVGSGGYRSGSVTAVIPVGKRGTLGLSYGQTEFGDSYGYRGSGYGYEGRGSPSMSFDASRDGRSMDPNSCASSGRDSAGYLDTSRLDRARIAGGRCPLR